MHRFLCTAGILFVAVAVAWADEPQKKPPADKTPAAGGDAASASEQLEAVQTEVSEKQREIIKRYREAEDDGEQQKVRDELKKLQAEILDKYADIAARHPNDEQIGEMCQQLAARSMPAEKLFRVLIKKSDSRDTKGLALLGLGRALSERSNNETDEAKRERLRKEAKESLQGVVRKYADIELGSQKLSDLANDDLFELEHLAVGLPVPDLEGDDLEGATFKVSDYRGKVVLLDFWAHW